MSGTAIDALQAVVGSMLAVVAPETAEPLLRDLVRRLRLAIARPSHTTRGHLTICSKSYASEPCV